MTARTHTPLLWLLIILVLFGLIAVASASSVMGQQRVPSDEFFFFKHQLLYGFIPGLIGFIIARRLPAELLQKLAFPAYLVAVALLGLVFVPHLGYRYGGASRWLAIGSFSFQPSDLAKIALIVYLAAWFEKQGPAMRTLQAGLVPFLIIVGVISGLLLLEPDVGTLVVTAVTAVTMFFLAGGRLRHIAATALIGVIIIGSFVALSQARLSRISTFLNPTRDTQNTGYHVNQSLVAIGSGGVFGRGLGQSRQKYNYLPEPAGDAIFAVIGEELGFMGASFLVLLYLGIAHQGLRLAQAVRDEFGRLLITGIIVLVIVQAFVNIAATTSLLPFTGVTLPMVSYGGTSLAIFMTAFGLVFSFASHAVVKKKR